MGDGRGKGILMRRLVRVLGMVTLLGLLFLASLWLTVWLGTAGKTVAVPDLQDRNVVDALKQVGKLGLDLRIVREEHSSEVPRNRIISQYPRPGTKLKADRNIEVVLSLGERNVAVPDVRGLPLRKAELVLRKNGLSPGRISRISSKDEEEIVLSQNPMPLAENVEENSVDLLVSAGPRTVEYRMPDLIGYSLGEAARLLEAAGLVIGTVRYEEYPGVQARQVTNQSPPFGYPVSPLVPVTLVVNKAETAPPAATVSRIPFAYRVPLRIPFPVAVEVFVEDDQGRRRVFQGYKMPATLLELTLEVSGKAVLEVYLNGRKAHSRSYTPR